MPFSSRKLSKAKIAEDEKFIAGQEGTRKNFGVPRNSKCALETDRDFTLWKFADEKVNVLLHARFFEIFIKRMIDKLNVHTATWFSFMWTYWTRHANFQPDFRIKNFRRVRSSTFLEPLFPKRVDSRGLILEGWFSKTDSRRLLSTDGAQNAFSVGTERIFGRKQSGRLRSKEEICSR